MFHKVLHAALASVLLASLCPGPSRAGGLPSGLAWHEIGSPTRAAHSMVWDARRQRALIIGGVDRHVASQSGVWELVLLPRPHWREIVPENAGPLPRNSFSAVYDSTGDRILLFGGQRDLSFGANDLWELPLATRPRWNLLVPEAGSPPPCRMGASMVITRDDRLVLFGGGGCARMDSSVWTLALRETPLHWQERVFSGPQPAQRLTHGAAYSALTHSMLVFGGQHSTNPNGFETRPVPASTWELILTEPMHWVQRAASPSDSTPTTRYGCPLVAESGGHGAWLLPAAPHQRTPPMPVWRYDFITSQWTSFRGDAATLDGFDAAAACYDPTASALRVQGGGSIIEEGAVAFHGDTWTLFTTGPPHWERTIAAWFRRALSQDPRAHLDGPRRRLVRFDAEGVWTCDLAGDATWRLDGSERAHGPRAYDMMSVVDTRRQRLLVFGGVDPVAGVAGVPADTIWAWSLAGTSGWTALPTFLGESRCVAGTAAAYDVTRDRVLVFSDPVFNCLDARRDTLVTLELSGEAPRWGTLATTGEYPFPLFSSTAVLDERRQQVYLLGGSGGGFFRATSGQASRLVLDDPARWESLVQPWVYRRPLLGATTDPVFDRLWTAGSGNALDETLDVATFQLHGPPEWTPVVTSELPTQLIAGGPLFFDPTGERFIKWNGRSLFELPLRAPTPILMGPAEVHADADGVRLRWSAEPSGDFAAYVQRTQDGGTTWRELAVLSPGSDGALVFTDPAPPTSGRLAYRIGIERRGEFRVLGTAALEFATSPLGRFALAPPRPNPVNGELQIELAIPRSAEVLIELFDLSGRLIGTPSKRQAFAGSTVHRVPLPASFAPGVYVVRASAGSRAASARFAVVR